MTACTFFLTRDILLYNVSFQLHVTLYVVYAFYFFFSLAGGRWLEIRSYGDRQSISLGVYNPLCVWDCRALYPATSSTYITWHTAFYPLLFLFHFQFQTVSCISLLLHNPSAYRLLSTHPQKKGQREERVLWESKQPKTEWVEDSKWEMSMWSFYGRTPGIFRVPVCLSLSEISSNNHTEDHRSRLKLLSFFLGFGTGDY